MKTWKHLGGGLVVLFLAVQLVPNELPPSQEPNAGDMIQSGLVTEDVGALLKKSCYSCHSNETNYPWYSYVAPSSWLVAKDVREGREELNFSEWSSYDMMDKLARLDDISSEVQNGEMPLAIYTLMHPSARLEDSQIASIVSWAEAAMDIVAEEEDIED